MNWPLFLIILLILVLVHRDISNKSEHFSSFSCLLYGDDYDSCYADPACTIGFLPNGETHCMHKFLYEDI